ncbi:MAG: glycosyltransferase family 4 protein [Promethearchaeota archaeon]
MSIQRKICIILPAPYPFARGGNEILFTEISREIMRRNNWEFVVLGRRPRTLGVQAFNNPLPTVLIDTLRTRFFGRLFEYIYLSFFDSFLFGLKVGLLSDNFLSDFDVVITFDPLVTTQIAKRKHRPPLIYFVGGAWADTISKTQPLLEPLTRWIERRAYKLADRIVVMDQIYASHVVSTNRDFVMIPSGVDSTIFNPVKYNRVTLREKYSMTGKTAIVTVATLRRGIKGYEVLLRAIPQIIRTHPECHFFLVGKGAQVWVRNSAKLLGVTQHVHLLGERYDIPALLAASDIFLLPSLSEGTPGALLEAMAMRLPCIATKVGGIPEVITHKRNGLLIEPGSPDAISKALLYLLSNGEKAKALGEQARKLILKRYSLEKTANAYSELIESLCIRS